MKWAAYLALMSHWRANPWQLLTLFLGLAMATALWSGVQAINAEARASYSEAANTLEQAASGRITSAEGPVTMDDFVLLRRAGWQVSPIIEGRLANGLQLVGIEPLTFPWPNAARPQGDGAGALDGFLGGGQRVIFAHPEDSSALTELSLPVRVDDNQTPGRAVADIALAQRILERNDFTSLLVAAEQPLSTARIEDVAPHLSFAALDTKNDVARLTDSFHLNLTAFGMLAFAVGIFIVYGAVGLAFEQRRPVFRTLRALGLPLHTMMGLLACELGALAFVAGAIGIVVGYGIAAALLPDVAATLRGLYGADITGGLSIRPEWWASGMAMAFFGTAVAGAGAFYKLRRVSLTASANPRAMRLQSAQTTRVLTWFAVGLIGLAGALTVFGSGLIAGFALLACLLTGAALLLPAMLTLALRVGGLGAKSVLAQWFWADTRQQLPGLSMALMALLLAMAANVGVSTMVSSFRLTFVGYLDQRLSSELYLRLETAEQATRVSNFIAPEVDAVLPIVSSQLRVGGLPAEIFGVIDHATYRDFWPMLEAVPDHWGKLSAGQGVMINEQLSRRQKLALGDQVEGDTVLGIYSDYGNSSGQIIIDMARFQARYPQSEPVRFGLRTDKPEEITRLLRSAFDLDEEALVNQQSIKDFSIDVFERTFAVTAALNVLTLSVAGLAILVSLLTLATMRLPQLAPVWALGMTRNGLAKLELIRALILAAFTGLAALPLGLALAWVLLAVVNVEAFGWRLPLYLFPADYLRLGGLTLVAAALAALWPAMRLARTPPGTLLKVFSGER
ncbi:MAG: ABC transporter permease [Litoreibacter sp.]